MLPGDKKDTTGIRGETTFWGGVNATI